MGPDQFAQQIVQAGQVPVLVSEVVRGKALALVLEQAKVVDESGRAVDLEALREDAPADQLVDVADDDHEASTTTRVTTTADRRTRRTLARGPCRTSAGALRLRPGERACADSEHPPGGEFCVQAPR